MKPVCFMDAFQICVITDLLLILGQGALTKNLGYIKLMLAYRSVLILLHKDVLTEVK